MIKLNYGQLNNPVLGDAINRISQEKGWANPKASYNVSRIMRQLTVVIKDARKEFMDFSEKFALKDENGVHVPSKVPGPLPFELKEDTKKEFEEQLTEFFKTETTLESNPITLEDLGDVQIAPNDFLSLEPFMAFGSLGSEAPGQNVLPFPQEQSPSH